MTRKANFPKMMTGFSEWMRKLKYPLDSHNYSAHNLDYIWHQYRENWLITIEAKEHGAKPTQSQKDTHGIVVQMLLFASGMTVETMRGPRQIVYRGHFILSFEKTTPDDSKWICISSGGNSIVGDGETIKQLLQFGTLSGLDDSVSRKPRTKQKPGVKWGTPRPKIVEGAGG